MRSRNLFILTLSVLITTACDSSKPPDKTPAESKIEHFATDQWVGHWKGPEGTFLEISGAQGKYQVIIQNLDGPITYPATSKEGKITFERNGLIETITPGDGQATGMKWLADKTNCLVIRSGEGFCKD